MCTVQVGIKPSQIIQPQAPLALSGCSFRPFPGLSLVLEIHIAHILDARGIEYEAQAKTENGKKPDFLFPSQAAYEDPAFPEEQLRMLASKTSIKDRFRQVADEANRIRDKHLFTLTPGDVTHPKLAQLDELHIHLVMPKVVKESYDDLIQGETMTFSRFIEEIQGLQADRPQSLTGLAAQAPSFKTGVSRLFLIRCVGSVRIVSLWRVALHPRLRRSSCSSIASAGGV